jgi:hypothetical protein
MKKNAIVEMISALLLFLFTYTALSKLLDFAKFKYQISQSPFITNISWLVIWSIPLAELIISILLVFKLTRLAGLYLSFFLMLLFTGYVFIMLRYSSYLPCSCGGVLSIMSWKQHFVFNLVFTGLSLAGVLLENSKSRENMSRMRVTGMKLNT